jgi:hypothetical protein
MPRPPARGGRARVGAAARSGSERARCYHAGVRALCPLATWLSLASAACMVDRIIYTPAIEDCDAAGDEDGNGLADCDDAAACAGAPACQTTTCVTEQCDGLDNDCSGTADDNEALGTARACAARSCVESYGHLSTGRDTSRCLYACWADSPVYYDGFVWAVR